MSNATSWSRIKYSLLAPVYDFGAAFDAERELAFRRLELIPGERLLLVGAGTGADIPHVPRSIGIVAVDLVPEMLERARHHKRPGVEFRQMDAHRLDFPTSSFDAVALHQLLEVVADPSRCLAEAARVVKPGGLVSVMDKFLPPGFHPPLWHRVATRTLDVVFTTADRSFEEIFERSGAPLDLVSDETLPPPSVFRVILLRKRNQVATAQPSESEVVGAEVAPTFGSSALAGGPWSFCHPANMPPPASSAFLVHP
jgi:ubiquinone/menaquinone biosynthesis C-methylase UbiE